MSFNWTCPYCNRDTTINEDRVHETSTSLEISNAEGHRRLDIRFIVCPNKECKRFTLSLTMRPIVWEQQGMTRTKRLGDILNSWNLLPPSKAKPFPEYIPEGLRADYQEACAILELSPKASATLSRRCLQGMIRNFWNVNKGRLVDEIDAIEDKVDPDVWAAIDAVRKVGNIGAHMERDISLIVDVDPDEAQKLIWLIELLMKEWYVARHERKERVRAVIAVAEVKQAAKTSK